jgi:16S rRNA (cytidine1402-2'-O)-methyltransferase
MDANKLYLVGPVREWQDLTLRARDVLRRARLVVVQDADQVRPHLEALGVQVGLQESEFRDTMPNILSALERGEVAWLLTRIDELSARPRLTRALVEQGIELVSVPGAPAMVGGLVASGLPADRFTALGLLPASADERGALWSKFARDPITLVCEVQAENLGEILDEAQSILGERRIAICQGEEVWRGPVCEGPASGWDGRVTLVVEGAGSEPDWTQERVLDEVRALLDAGTSPRDTARAVARQSGWPRRRVYELALRASYDEG